MSYATAEELRQRIGVSVFNEIYAVQAGAELTGRSDIADDLESASAEIDGAIASRYALPVTGERSLALLKDWTLTLAEERAYARPAGGSFTEKIRRRADQVRKYLDMIRADEFKLPDAGENTSGPGSTIALIRCDEPIFDRGKMNGY